jgi:hypothetical protein
MLDIFQQNKNIIINSDIDGILSGLILSNYLNCKVVGFSNSDNLVWIDKSMAESIYDVIYIDMFVADPNVKCIDQHIVSINEQHHRILNANPNKLNPNLDNPRFHLPNNSYYNKYPFGTVHYLIALLESEGIRIDLDFMKTAGDLKFIDLILRADDAMKTTVDSNYSVNAASWWNWLTLKSLDAKSIKTMRAYLNELNANSASSIKQKTTSLLTNPDLFACSSPDGGYKSIIDSNGLLLPKVIKYISFMAQSSGMNCFNLSLSLTPQIGRANRTSLSNNQVVELINYNTINGEDIFSYAFVRSSNRGENFSYTIM